MDKFFTIVCVFLIYFTKCSLSVKIRSFYVPGKAGNEAPLLCGYDLESGKLYDVKWYKDGEQFFRCEPNGITTAFPVEGVKIQQIKYAPLGACSLTLMMLTQRTAGEYKCEVNTEGPKFDTASESKFMSILEPTSKRLNHTQTLITNNSVINYQHDIEDEAVSASTSSELQFDMFLLISMIAMQIVRKYW